MPDHGPCLGCWYSALAWASADHERWPENPEFDRWMNACTTWLDTVENPEEGPCCGRAGCYQASKFEAVP